MTISQKYIIIIDLLDSQHKETFLMYPRFNNQLSCLYHNTRISLLVLVGYV